MEKKIVDFFELDAWKKAHLYALEIYKVTRVFPNDELYGMTSQLRRAASSVTANIAEGFSRYHYNDKTKFYYNARASVSEVQSFLFLSRDLGYLEPDTFKQLFSFAKEVGKLINGLIRSIDKQK